MSSGGSELRGFVFAVVFIIVFATLLSSIPAGLQGPNEQPDTVIPLDPNLLAGFADTQNYTQSSFDGIYGLYEFTYDLGGREWLCWHNNVTIQLAAKIKIGGFLWLGGLEYCDFVADDDRGSILTFDEIMEDAEEGTIRYTLRFSENAQNAGSLVVYWNSTKYPEAITAWDNDELYLLHGVGLDSTATANIGALIVSLLTLQLPDVPVLVNLFIAVPVWACIVFVVWFIVKEMIPFV